MAYNININLKITKTVWYYLLILFRIKIDKKPLVNGYINNEKSFSLCLADITTEK